MLLLAILAVAAAALFARYGIAGGGSGIQLAQWRLTSAAVVLLVLAPIRDRSVPFSPADRWRILGAGIFLALHFAAWLSSLQWISVARSTLLVATSPVWAGILGLFVPSLKPGKNFWWGLAVSAVGLVLFTSLSGTGGRSLLGDAEAISGAIFVLGYFLLSKEVQQRHGTWRTVTWIYAVSALAMWPMVLASGQSLFVPTPAFWIGVLGMAICAQLLGHTAMNWSLRHFEAGEVAAATLAEPVFAGALAWFLLGERLSPMQIIGGAVLLFGLWIALRQS